MSKQDFPEIRELIDRHLSLQWCRENVVIPLKIINGLNKERSCVLVAVGNYSYLSTIGEFIKLRLAAAELTCQFTELPIEDIQAMLDEATMHTRISGSPDNQGFSDREVLNILQAADEFGSEEEYEIEFDDSEEDEEIEEGVPDLSIEILGSQIQRAAAQLLISCCRSRVSDIHIEPRRDDYTIRVRREGAMQSYVCMPRSAGIKLTACLKNMAKMNIAEKKSAQDGKIVRTFEGQTMEFRCTTSAGKHGETMVLRIINSNAEMLSLDLLVGDNKTLQSIRDIAQSRIGLIVFTGPIGSGKSTTVTSLLRELDTGELNIVTAEDPLEYDLGGNIKQYPVIRAKGQTFADLLRIFLRQDPDIILVGETRDPETAESCMDAAETGHLVLTQMYQTTTSRCASTLMDMEVPAYKINSCLRGIVGQRLVKRVCPECSSERPINDAESRFTGLSVGTPVRFATTLSAVEKKHRLRDETLCTACAGSGYLGRVAAYEVLMITPKIQSLIRQRKSSDEIQEAAVAEGMTTLKMYALDLISKGMTTISEVQRVFADG